MALLYLGTPMGGSAGDRSADNGLIAISNNFFSAAKNQTVTKFAAAHQVPALQLEINAAWLLPAESQK
ncbi:MAG: hypothetical protein ACLQJ0_20965 [Steroidobacteraceae bacterium]|jgi:hypothetical protein